MRGPLKSRLCLVNLRHEITERGAGMAARGEQFSDCLVHINVFNNAVHKVSECKK